VKRPLLTGILWACVIVVLGYLVAVEAGAARLSPTATPGQRFADSLAFAYRTSYNRGPHPTVLVAFFCNPYGKARFAGQQVFRCLGIEQRKNAAYRSGTIFLTPDGGALTPDEAKTALEGSIR
jgi:hypothetical protein